MAGNSGAIRRSDIYNDPDFNYAHFWRGRGYEHKAEVIAIRRLLNGRRFGHAVDVGGGFGRLSVVLAFFADHVTLVDPSSQQLDLSRRLFPDHPALNRRLMDAADLQFSDESIDLIAMIRVLHHLPGPRAEFAELWRVLRPGGFAVVEAANSAHAVNRVRHLLRQERIPESEVDARSEQRRRSGAAAYVNHHPCTVSRQLTEVGLPDTAGAVGLQLPASAGQGSLAGAGLGRHGVGCAAAAGQATSGRAYSSCCRRRRPLRNRVC